MVRGPSMNQFLDDLEPTAVVDYHKPSGDSALDHAIMEYRPRASIYAGDDLASPLIVFNHAFAEDKDARLEMISVDILTWALENSSPANVMLIVGDISEHIKFSFIFRRLQYNFLLAQPENVSWPPQLLGDTKLLWESLSLGSIASVKRDRSLPSPVVSGRFLLAGIGIGALVCLGFACVSGRYRYVS